jgi:hypothetical protein
MSGTSSEALNSIGLIVLKQKEASAQLVMRANRHDASLSTETNHPWPNSASFKNAGNNS